MECFIHGKKVKCKVTENRGYQGGRYVKAVEYEGKEYIVIKDSRTWRMVDPIEKLKPVGNYIGQ